MSISYIDSDKLFFKIENDAGFAVIFCKIGAGIYRIDYHGKPMNMAFEDTKDYLEDRYFYFGRTVGPIAGRIRKGVYSINGERYQLERNEKGNSLHSGSASYAYRAFDAEIVEGSPTKVIFRLKTEPFEGYPASCDIQIVYSIPKDKPELLCEYAVTPDHDAPIKLTNHAYYNLGGEPDILHHRLFINGKKVMQLDNELLPEKEVDVTKTLDFSTMKEIGRDIHDPAIYETTFAGYDHIEFFDEVNPDIPQIMLESKQFQMKVYTDCRGTVFYSYNYPSTNRMLFNGVNGGKKHVAIAIEPQDAYVRIEDNIVKAGATYRRFYHLEFAEK